jgi:pyrroloquinoline quinone (PQQ) biosynthesis protein C
MNAKQLVTAQSLYDVVKSHRVVDHPWFKNELKTGKAKPGRVQAMTKQLIVYYDNIIQLYGPMYMNNADYKVRRLFVDKMLKPIKLNGTKLRLGEGAHAELARQLARAVGVSANVAKNPKASALVAERIDRMIATLERPQYWVTLGACAAAENQMKGLHTAMAKALKTHYKVKDKHLKVFKAPMLFNREDLDRALGMCTDEFDQLRIQYYTERFRDEWYDLWDAVFTSGR